MTGLFSTEDSIGKAIMLTSTERMSEFLKIMRKFPMLTWEDVEDLVTVGVWNEGKQTYFFDMMDRERNKGAPSPSAIINLKKELRIAVAQSFHIVDKLGGITGLGSMVFEPDEGMRTWNIYNPRILTANYVEGQFGRISGLPRRGKTNIGCVIMEQMASDGNVNFSNIRPTEGKADERYTYVRDAKELFEGIAGLDEDTKWLFTLDEGGLMYSKADAATRRAKDLDKLVRVLGKLHGSMNIIEQRPESVPTILQEFSTCLFYANSPGIVSIELKGPTLAFRDTVKDFPATTLPFNTYDIGFFSVNVNIVGMLAALSGPGDPKKTMLNYIQSAGMPGRPVSRAPPPTPVTMNLRGQYEGLITHCLRCGNPLDNKRSPLARYCSASCRVTAAHERMKEREALAEQAWQEAHTEEASESED